MQQEIDAFLNYLSGEKDFSDNTIVAYRNDLSQLMNFAQEQSRKQSFALPWFRVDRQLISSYVIDLKRRGYAPATVARKVATARSFFKFLLNQGIIENSPTEGLGSPRARKSSPLSISIAQVEELLEQPEKYSTPEAKRDKAMLELLYASGVRVSELMALNLEDINLQKGEVHCSGRGSKQRDVPINNKALQFVQKYVEEARPHLVRHKEKKAIFLNRFGERLTRQGFWQIFKSYAKEAKLGGKVTPHTLRHSLATHLLGQGEDLDSVKKRLGHANIASTQVYVQLVTKRA